MKAADSFKFRFSESNLADIYCERIVNSSAIGIDRVRAAGYSAGLASEISLINKRVFSSSYTFSAYKEKLISKGAGANPRQISIPTVRDRITLRALCECIGDVYPQARLKLPHAVIESLKSALSSGLYTEFAKIDLEKFYPSIPHALVMKSTWGRIRKPEIRKLISSSIATPTIPEGRSSSKALKNSCGVPQGLAVSNLLAEISLLGLDSIFSCRPGLWYCRYVDDILILTGDGQAETFASEIISHLKKMKLKAHPPGPGSKTKVGCLSEDFSFLGYAISRGEVSIRRESVLRFESSIAKILTAYKHKSSSLTNSKDRERALAYCRWKINLRITGCFFNGKRLGWVSYFSQITTTSQLRSISWTVSKLISRFGLNGRIKPKSLIKTYYETISRSAGSGSYIPNFDALTPTQKRERLAMWIGDRVNSMSDDKVDKILNIKIRKAVRDLEADIAQTS